MPTTTPKKNKNAGSPTRSPLRDMRLLLQDELARRCANNPNYSLRSFAKTLAISPSCLSFLLSGKREISAKMKEQVGLKLGLSFEELEQMEGKVHGNSKLPAALEKAPPFQQITTDVFNIISEPYHYALLELIKTQGFQPKPRWIAQRLGITVSEANIALDRLERADLIVRDKNGNISDTTNGFSTDLREGLSSQAQRRFLVRALQNAITAIEEMPIAVRDNTSVTLAVSAQDLPRAKKMIKEFRRSFAQNLEKSAPLDEVYQLSIAFIPLTKSDKNLRSSS